MNTCKDLEKIQLKDTLELKSENHLQIFKQANFQII